MNGASVIDMNRPALRRRTLARSLRGGLKGGEYTWAVAFVVPYLAVFLAFVVYPVIYGLWMGSDAQLYRDKAEVEAWKQRDPIVQLMRRLTEQSGFTGAERAALDEQVESEIARAVAFAEAGTWEPIEQLAADVYTPRAQRG